MQNNVDTIITNAITVDKTKLSDNLNDIINKIKIAIDSNKDTIKAANAIDLKNKNGFDINLDIIDNIFNNLMKEKTLYGDVILSQKDDDKKIIYGKQIFDKGNVVVITDGNTYTLIEIAIRNIIAGNTTILSNSGYMFGTNQLIVQIIQNVLEQSNISKYLLQIYLSENFDELLNNYANIDLVICIGDHNLQRTILNKSKNDTITSGYESFDLYVEDDTHIEFIKEIINTGIAINLYTNKRLDISHRDSIVVNDIDEAIALINYNGNRYSTAIFTNSSDNASKFIREVKSKLVTVNTSPTIERLLDVKQSDLYNEKTIIYPVDYKTDGKRIEINI